MVVIGVVQAEDDHQFTLTPAGQRLDSLSGGDLASRLASSGPVVKAGTARTLGLVHQDLGPVVVVGLGKESAATGAEEGVDGAREGVRKAAAAGVRAAAALKAKEVHVEGLGDAEAAAEGATLANWVYDRFKTEKKPLPEVGCLVRGEGEGAARDGEGWARGLVLGRAQNLARELMEAPANFLTPSQFCAEAEQALAGLPVEIVVRDQAWAEQQSMGSFLSVARGAAEPLRFLQLTYRGGEEGSPPVVLVGKGVTFDTGGISLKPSAKMDLMRADMGGAATVVGTMTAVARLALPINLTVLCPLTENMPGSRATRPGDVVTAMNGKTIQVDNTDAEGRLILADALCYADTLNPSHVLDVATLTGAMSVALGTGAAGAFCSRSSDWSVLESCGVSTGDRVWRMPLWNHYTEKMKVSPLADLNNAPVGGGGACTAAAFLREFTSCPSWIHLDIAGVMENSGDVAYLGKGMSGRPTRTMVEFVAKMGAVAPTS